MVTNLIKTRDFSTVRYIHGVTNQLADCLSWLGHQKYSIKLPKLHIHKITSQLHEEVIVYKM